MCKFRGFGELDATGFSASAGVYLGFDYDNAAFLFFKELLGCLPCFIGGESDDAFRYGNPEFTQYILTLIFVNIHGLACLLKMAQQGDCS